MSRLAPPNWPGSAAFNYICFEQNPLLGAIRESRTRYRFGDFAPHGERAYGGYWEALGEAGMAEALCATSYGAGMANTFLAARGVAVGKSLCEHDLTGEAEAIQRAGLVLTERLIDLADPPPVEAVTLTTREHDALRYVADGKTDWEIGVIFGVAESTARFHVDNARRKLGAVNRAQAVARMVVQRLI